MKFLNRDIDIVKPSSRSSNGGASEGYSIRKETLKKIIDNHHLLNKNKNTEMFEKYFKKKKDLKVFKLLNSSYETKNNFRLTLDYIEDYIFLSKLKSKFSFRTSRRLINKFLDKNLDLRKINFFRNKEWKFAKKNKNS